MGIDGGRTDCLWLHTETNRGRDVGHNKRRHWIRWQVLGPFDGEHVGLGLRGDDNRGITISNRTNMNKQQTAVEWQYIELSKFLNGKSEFTHKSDILIKAKEMEKQQAIKLYYEYDLYLMMNESSVMTFGKFYKQTYGDDKQ